MEYKNVKNELPTLTKESDTFGRSEKMLVLVSGEYPLVAKFEKDTSLGDEYEAWYCEEYDDVVDDVTHWTETPKLPTK